MNIRRVGFITDTHINHEDLRAYDICMQTFSFSCVSTIVILGDFGDGTATSGHGDKRPDLDVSNLLVREIECVNKRLDELDKHFPKAEKIYIEGNHEFRLDRYLRNKAPELFGLISYERLVKLHERENWKWVPFGPDQKVRILNSKLWARHRPPASSAKAALQKSMCSLVYGDIHRIESCQLTGMDGSVYKAECSGWLGDKRKKIFDYVSNHHQWQLGFGIAHVLDSGEFFYQTQQIINYKTYYEAKVIKA